MILLPFLPFLVAPEVQPSKPQAKVIHGRLFVANGNPAYRIWIVGTKRILAVVPGNTLDGLPKQIHKHIRFGVNIFGDFSIEELEPSIPGQMQHVRVLSVQRVVIEETEHPDGPRIFRLPDVAL